jgi:hypothetical protein
LSNITLCPTEVGMERIAGCEVELHDGPGRGRLTAAPDKYITVRGEGWHETYFLGHLWK